MDSPTFALVSTVFLLILFVMWFTVHIKDYIFTGRILDLDHGWDPSCLAVEIRRGQGCLSVLKFGFTF